MGKFSLPDPAQVRLQIQMEKDATLVREVNAFQRQLAEAVDKMLANGTHEAFLYRVHEHSKQTDDAVFWFAVHESLPSGYALRYISNRNDDSNYLILKKPPAENQSRYGLLTRIWNWFTNLFG